MASGHPQPIANTEVDISNYKGHGLKIGFKTINNQNYSLQVILQSQIKVNSHSNSKTILTL